MSGPRWTDRPASAAECFPQAETRNIELPGTAGADGQPLVVTIRRLPILHVLSITIDKDSVESQSHEMARMAEAAIVTPQFRFGPSLGSGGQPAWDDLPFAAQMEVVNAVSAFTTEGLGEVRAQADAFRRGAGDSTNGAAGVGPDEAGATGEASPRMADRF